MQLGEPTCVKVCRLSDTPKVQTKNNIDAEILVASRTSVQHCSSPLAIVPVDFTGQAPHCRWIEYLDPRSAYKGDVSEECGLCLCLYSLIAMQEADFDRFRNLYSECSASTEAFMVPFYIACEEQQE